jgi:hypothetical protein
MRPRTHRLAWLLTLLATAAGLNIVTSANAWAVSPPATFTVKVVPAASPSSAICAYGNVGEIPVLALASETGCTWWTFTRMSGDYYRITSTNSGYCLDPMATQGPDMTQPLIAECRDGIDQLWQLSPTFGRKDASWIKAASADLYLGEFWGSEIVVAAANAPLTDHSFSVTRPDPVSINTSSVPAAKVGARFTNGLTASGGTDVYVWSVISGTLPAGLTLSSTGWISGTPVKEAATTVTVQASSIVPGLGTATKDISITVNPAT